MSAEDDFIARHFRPIAGPAGLGLRDDAALIEPPPGCDLVVTTDAVVAGVHFFADDPPGDIARKALRVNLSDLAAKGAMPLGFVMTLAVPRDCGEAWVALFAAALGEDARHYGCPLIGGDTVATPGPLSISITAFGIVPNGKMVRRDGAKAGDWIYITGTIGDAALGLAVRNGDIKVSPSDREVLVARYRVPQPRTAIAAALREHANAAMDVSDGLVGDLSKMLSLASLGATMPVSAIPFSPAAQVLTSDMSNLERAVTGGDDYEILCSIPDARRPAFEGAAQNVDVPITRLGRVDTGPTQFIDQMGRPLILTRSAFSHM